MSERGATGGTKAAAADASVASRVSALLGIDRQTALPALGSGLVVSLAILVPVVSYPSLIFSGPLEPFSGLGVGLGLLSALVLTLSLVFGGSIPGTVAVAQSEPAVVMGVVAVQMAAELQAAGRADQLLSTIAVTIAMSTAAVAAVFLLLGTLRLGNIVRFVPYPLIVGFIGGMGWLLIGGAVRVVTGLPLAVHSLPALADPGQVLRWLPALLAGAGLWLLQRRRPRALNVPLAGLGIVVAFWLAVLVTGTSYGDLVADEWMLAPVPPPASWLPMHQQAITAAVSWPVILGHWPQILTLVTVSLMGVLMQASVIEIAARSDIDLNRELRVLGAGNLVCGVAGSLPGYHSLSTSLLSLRTGRPVRAVSLTVAVVIALILAFGGAAVAFLPKLLIGALLFYVGLDVFIGALLNVHLRRAWAEYAVAMLVFAVVAFVGLLEGLTVGVAAGIVLFVVKYSQVDVIRREGSAVERHSRVVRPARARQVLNELGDQVLILELQSYIFFGTSNLLVNRIRNRLADRSRPPLRFILLDMRRVTGIDSSVSLSLGKLAQYGRTFDVTLLVTGLQPQLRGTFERLAAQQEGLGRIRLFSDLDHGLEHAEDCLLSSAAAAGVQLEETFPRLLRKAGGDETEIATLLRYVRRESYAGGQALIRQGEASRDIFFVERGSVTVRLVLPDGRGVRLRTMGAGTVVGEVAVYLHLPRSASVVADGETVVLRVSAEAIEDMRRQAPAAAALLHAFMARELADKLIAATQQLAASHG